MSDSRCSSSPASCLRCLLRGFRRLTPVPELHDALAAHLRAGGRVAPRPFPAPGVATVAALAAWKIDALAAPLTQASPFRLHVVAADTLEVSSHRVLPDPECPTCAG